MHSVKGKNINEVIYQLLNLVVLNGYRTESRNGDVLAIYDTEIILEDPRSRHLNLVGRTNNIFATIAETFWVLSGGREIKPYLSFFVPRAPKYSDDGVTWRAAYGERLYSYGQLNSIVDTFVEEGISSRRAVLSLYMPHKDTKESLKKVYGIENTLDTPCNNWINFFIKPDKSLNMKITQRSGDIIFGVSNINLFEFSVLQEMVLEVLKEKVDRELTLGYYHHSVTNLHLYDFNGEQGYKILENKLKHKFGRSNVDRLKFPSSINTNKEFFVSLVDFYTDLILGKKNTHDGAVNKMKTLFKKFNIPISDNLLWAYALSVLAYIFQNNYKEDIYLDINEFCEDFKDMIRSNHFNKSIVV